MKFLLTLLALLVFSSTSGQISGLPFQNIQQINPAYAGVEGDFSAKIGAMYERIYNNYNYYSVFPYSYASADLRIKPVRSSIGLSVNYENYDKGYYEELNTNLNYNYTVGIGDKYTLRIGSALRNYYFDSDWLPWPPSRRSIYPYKSWYIDPGIWLSSDSGRFDFGISSMDLINLGKTHKIGTYFSSHVNYIVGYKFLLSKKISIKPFLMVSHTLPGKYNKYLEVTSADFAVDFTYNKEFHAGLFYRHTRYNLLAANIGYTYKDKLRLTLSKAIYSSGFLSDPIEAMLGLRL